jgi:ParB family chromosome partitioning protein
MSKLDELRRAAGSNVSESMGKGVSRSHVTHGASAPPSVDRWAGVDRLAGAQRIAVDRIVRDPSQPREAFDEAELAELAESIRDRGVLQPIRVRWDEAMGSYVVIAGERRFRASRAAGLDSVPCVIHDAPMTESEILLDQLAENLVRLDLQPIEQARSFRRLMDANEWSARRLAEALHIDHDKVNRAVRLLDLPEPVRDAVASGGLAPSTAFELTKLEDAAAQAEVAERVVAERLSRAETIEAVKRAAPTRKAGAAKGRGGSKSSKPIVKSFRRPDGKVTVELRKGIGPEAIEAMLASILQELRDQQCGQEAA